MRFILRFDAASFRRHYDTPLRAITMRTITDIAAAIRMNVVPEVSTRVRRMPY